MNESMKECAGKWTSDGSRNGTMPRKEGRKGGSKRESRKGRKEVRKKGGEEYCPSLLKETVRRLV